jgi:hypothetical protein
MAYAPPQFGTDGAGDMADFSGGTAISSGFQLIARKPGAVLAWGVVYMLLAVVPQVLVMWTFLPDLMAFYRDAISSAQSGASPATNPEFLRIQAELNRFQPLQIVLSLVSLSIINSAIFRAVLEPQNSRWAYLRLGAQELWVGLTTVVFYLVAVAAAVVAVIPVIVITAIAAQSPSWTTGLIVFLLGCGAAFFVIWVCLRLSLGIPMSFAQKNFRLFESWSMTKGLGWKLFGVGLAVFAIIIAIEFALILVAASVFAASGVAQSGQLQAMFQHPPADLAAQAMPWLIGLAVGYTVLIALVFAIITAPFADIYRQISGTTDTQVF